MPTCEKTSDCNDLNYLCLEENGGQKNCVRKCTEDDNDDKYKSFINKNICQKASPELCTF